MADQYCDAKYHVRRIAFLHCPAVVLKEETHCLWSDFGWQGADNDADGSNHGESEQGLEACSMGAYSLSDFAAEPSYHVIFSQHFRQVLRLLLEFRFWKAGRLAKES